MFESSLDITSICSPSRLGHYKKTNSCFLPNELKNIAELHNKKSPIQINTNVGDKDMIRQLTNGKCESESCLLTITSLEMHLKHIFKPKKPHSWYINDREWLSSIDIDNVLVQYIDEYFDFLGVFPINFADRIGSGCVSDKICNTDRMMDTLIKMGKRSFGVVFNLDRYDQRGSHWVSMYCNIDPASKLYGIHYYDSMAVAPRFQFTSFMNNVQQYVNNLRHTREFQKKINVIKKQFKKTECGMYSMLFLISCHEKQKHVDFDSICKSMKDDDDVANIRNILYATFN